PEKRRKARRETRTVSERNAPGTGRTGKWERRTLMLARNGPEFNVLVGENARGPNKFVRFPQARADALSKLNSHRPRNSDPRPRAACPATRTSPAHRDRPCRIHM